METSKLSMVVNLTCYKFILLSDIGKPESTIVGEEREKSWDTGLRAIMSIYLFIYLFIFKFYLSIYGCVGSSFLCEGFL